MQFYIEFWFKFSSNAIVSAIQLFKSKFIFFNDIIRIRKIFFSSIGNIWRLPKFFYETLLNPIFYLVKMLKIALDFCHCFQNILSCSVITDRVLFGNGFILYF